MLKIKKLTFKVEIRPNSRKKLNFTPKNPPVINQSKNPANPQEFEKSEWHQKPWTSICIPKIKDNFYLFLQHFKPKTEWRKQKTLSHYLKEKENFMC